MTNRVVPDTAIPVAEIKLFLEHLLGDRSFEQILKSDPLAATRACGFDWDPVEVREIWDPKFASSGVRQPTPSVTRYLQYVKDLASLRNRQAGDFAEPSHPRHRLWRRRQIERQSRALGDQTAGSLNPHVPCAFELASGCSVGCSFCAFSAERLTSLFRYDEPNAALWRDLLGVVRKTVGDGASWAFCYWATDPLDNPDYERFCEDFYEILGAFPSTTTALALKNPSRTRAFLQLSRDRGCRLNRFSLLSLKHFRKVVSTFSAEELACVSLVGWYPESRYGLIQAGRTIDRQSWAEDLFPSTIACVSGFLFNMVTRTVKLITPCGACERWPLGYMVMSEKHFDSAENLGTLLDQMLKEGTVENVEDLPTLKFGAAMSYQRQEDGFKIHHNAGCDTFVEAQGHGTSQYLGEVGEAIEAGTSNARDLAQRLETRHGVSASKTIEFLEELFRRGLLWEEPSLK